LCGRRLASTHARIDGVTDVRPRSRWVGSPDVHLRFRYRGREAIVWKPYGDNSRWWIGPENAAGSDPVADGTADGVRLTCLAHDSLATSQLHWQPPLNRNVR
jgi:hypothetical protein